MRLGGFGAVALGRGHVLRLQERLHGLHLDTSVRQKTEGLTDRCPRRTLLFFSGTSGAEVALIEFLLGRVVHTAHKQGAGRRGGRH